MTDVKVRFVAQDEATEVARLLLETMRQLQREQRTTQTVTNGVARGARDAADGFARLGAAITSVRHTGGLSEISKSIQLLSNGLQFASTRAQSLRLLIGIEKQLELALKRSSLTVADRIRLEQELLSVRTALGRGIGAVTGTPTASAGLFGNVQALQAGLLALGGTIAASRLLRLTGDAIDAADAMGELSQRTGVAVETLSVLTAEGQKAGVSVEGIEQGFRQLSRSLGELRSGNQEAIASFAALGLAASDFEGLDLAQSMVLIANAQARFADGSGKVAAALRIFGRSGEELIPLLNELADGGFDRATQRAERLGLVLSTDAARAADEAKDAVANLGGAIRGFTNEMLSSLGPLTTIIKAITEVLAVIPDGVKAFAAAATIAGAAALKLATSVAILTIALKTLETTTITGRGIALAIGAVAVLAGLVAATISAVQNLKKETQTLDQAAPATGKPQVPTIVDPAQAKALRTAELAAQRDHARDVLAMERSRIQKQEAITEAAFAQGIVSITTFYAKRLQAVQHGIAAERAALEAERDALRGAPLTEDTDAARVARRNEIARIEAQIARLAVDGQTRVLQLVEQERQARQTLATQARSLAIELLQAAGQEAKATRIQIEEAARKAAETLRAIPGFTEQQIKDIESAFSTLLHDRAAFDSLNAKAQRELAQLSRERADIEERARLGLISQRDAQLQIAKLEQGRLAGLQELLSAIQQFAERTSDPVVLEAAKQLLEQFRGMGTVVDELQVKVVNLGTSLREGFQESLSSFLGSGINQAKNALDALRLLVIGIAEMVQRITADIVSTQITRAIFGTGAGSGLKEGAVALGGSAVALSSSAKLLITAGAVISAAAAQMASAATLAAAFRIVPPMGFAVGGYVRGTGTATSDSILARLSSGEFVVRAAVVQQPGMKQLLTALNTGLRTPRLRSLDRYGVPRFAEGGLVTAGVSKAAPLSGKLELEVAHSEDTILRVLRTPEATNTVVRIVQKNRELFRSVLG